MPHETGFINFIKSVFTQPTKPPLIIEKYYVLTTKGVLKVYEKWDSQLSNVVEKKLDNYEITILTPQKQRIKY